MRALRKMFGAKLRAPRGAEIEDRRKDHECRRLYDELSELDRALEALTQAIHGQNKGGASAD